MSSRNESGAVAVMVALLLTVLLLVSAFVLDLGALRVDRVAGKGAADMAAAAAVVDYQPGVSGSALEACEEALEYAIANMPGVDSMQAQSSCADHFTSYTCTQGDAERVASYVQAPYRLEITLPVHTSSTLLDGFSHTDHDGAPCERVGVRVIRDRSFLFAAVSGFVGSSTNPGSVGRAAGTTDGEPVALVVLKREGCDTISTSGQGRIIVNRLVTPSQTYPGVITVDSMPQGCLSGGRGPIISTNSSNHTRILADDHLFSYALRREATQSHVYDSGEVALGKVTQPTPGRLVTRSPVDDLVNCLADYDIVSAYRWSPSHEDSIGEPDGGCDSSQTGGGSYIQPLYDKLQPLGAPLTSSPAPASTVSSLIASGWTVFPDPTRPSESCHPNATAHLGPDHTKSAATSGRRVYINCGAMTPGNLRLEGVETVVVRNGFSMGSGDLFETVPPASGAVLYVQQGDIIRSGGTLRLNHTFVYLENGKFQTTGGGEITWRAPMASDQGSCGGHWGEDDIPAAECLSPLALWSNLRALSTDHQINIPGSVNRMGGNASLTFEGSFFTPNSVFAMTGNTSHSLTEAQFFAAEFLNRGQGDITMRVSPNLIDIQRYAGGLIR